MNEEMAKKNDFRRDLFDSLRDELLGPAGGDDESLRERPTLRYLVGRLAPHDTAVNPEEDDDASDVGADNDDADVGYASPISMTMNPSSIGISFIAIPEVQELEVIVRWGQYELEEHEEEGKDGKVRKRRRTSARRYTKSPL